MKETGVSGASGVDCILKDETPVLKDTQSYKSQDTQDTLDTLDTQDYPDHPVVVAKNDCQPGDTSDPVNLFPLQMDTSGTPGDPRGTPPPDACLHEHVNET